MGSWDKEIIEFLALPPSSCSVIPPTFPPQPRLPLPIDNLPYAALFMLRTARSRGGSFSALHSCRLFLPAAQLAAWVTGTNSPSCDFCCSSSECSTAPPSSGQPNSIPWGLQLERPITSGFPAVGKGEFCPNRGKQEKEERERER